MPEIFIDGRAVQAEDDQTVMQAARAAGIEIPHFCWHPALSVPGNCRICMVEVEGRGTDIACNMPVKAGMKVLTDSEEVRAHRKAILQFTLLNHPVDCGICDKAGECTLQDYHYRYNGEASISADAKVRSTKFFELSRRIVLDNERCILCSRCVRFTREVSKSNALGIKQRADVSVVRPAADTDFDADPYSDNVIDICPVGALLSRSFLNRSRVWYLEPTPSVCPGGERGGNIDIWHRRREWRHQDVDARGNAAILRVTPRENPAVNGPWICNKARDLAGLLERPRALEPLVRGKATDFETALASARALLAGARRPVALVSSWGSNEELAAFRDALGARFTALVKADHLPAPGERLEDALLIRPDKNPNRAGARALFGDAPAQPPADADLLLGWGEGFDFDAVPAGARVIYLDAWASPDCARAEVFLPLSIQTERSGHYTNFEETVSAFETCFPKPPSVSHAAELFRALAGAAPS